MLYQAYHHTAGPHNDVGDAGLPDPDKPMNHTIIACCQSEAQRHSRSCKEFHNTFVLTVCICHCGIGGGLPLHDKIRCYTPPSRKHCVMEVTCPPFGSDPARWKGPKRPTVAHQDRRKAELRRSGICRRRLPGPPERGCTGRASLFRCKVYQHLTNRRAASSHCGK